MTSRPYDAGGINSEPRLNDFAGGVVDVPESASESGLRANQSPYSYNIDTSGRTIRKQRGFTRVTASATTGEVSGLWHDGQTGLIFVAHGTTLATLNGATLSNIAGVPTLTANQRTRYARLGDYVISVNGADAPVAYDHSGPSVSTITTDPATWTSGNWPHFVVEWQGRLFAATQDGFLYYSKLFDAMDWTPGTTAEDGGAILVNNDGGYVLAAVPYDRLLILLTTTGLQILEGSSSYVTGSVRPEFDQRTFDWYVISNEPKFVSPDAWVVADNALYAWTHRGPCRITSKDNTRTGVRIEYIGDAIARQFKSVVKLQNEIQAAHYPDRHQVWFSVAQNVSSTQLDYVLIYDYANIDPTTGYGAWNIRKGYAHKCMANVLDVNGVVQIYSGGYNGLVYKQNDGVDYDDQAMSWEHYTAHYPMATIAIGRTPIVTLMLGSRTTGSFTYGYSYDFSVNNYDSVTIDPPEPESEWTSDPTRSTWGTTYGVGTTGTWVSPKPFVRDVRVFGSGRRIQHRFHGNTKGADFDILEIMHPNINVGYV